MIMKTEKDDMDEGWLYIHPCNEKDIQSYQIRITVKQISMMVFLSTWPQTVLNGVLWRTL